MSLDLRLGNVHTQENSNETVEAKSARRYNPRSSAKTEKELTKEIACFSRRQMQPTALARVPQGAKKSWKLWSQSSNKWYFGKFRRRTDD